MLGHLHVITPELGHAVESVLGMEGAADSIQPIRAPIKLEPSPALSMQKKPPQSLNGRKLGVLLGEGFDPELLASVKAAAEGAGAVVELVARKVGGVVVGNKKLPVDHALAAAPSFFFDTVAVLTGEAGLEELLGDADAVAWLRDAFAHLKIIGFSPDAEPLVEAADIKADTGIVPMTGKRPAATFVETAKQLRIWAREKPHVTPGRA
jgi:catalase